MGWTAAITSIASAAVGAEGARRANQEQKKAASTDRARAGIEQRRNVRRQIAERRRAEAELIAAGQSQGIRQSSGIEGAVGSLRSDSASSIGFSNTAFAANQAISRRQQRAANIRVQYGAVSDLFGGVSTGASFFA